MMRSKVSFELPLNKFVPASPINKPALEEVLINSRRLISFFMLLNYQDSKCESNHSYLNESKGFEIAAFKVSEITVINAIITVIAVVKIKIVAPRFIG